MEAGKGNVASLWSSLVVAVGGVAVFALGWVIRPGGFLASSRMIIFWCLKHHSFMYLIHLGGYFRQYGKYSVCYSILAGFLLIFYCFFSVK